MKIVVITGATSGIGLETAKAFLNEYGCKVKIISISRSMEHIERTRKELPQVDYYSCDLSNYETVKKTAQQIKEKYGRVDVLVNNAGMIVSGGVESLDPEQWDKLLKNNLSAYFYTTQSFLPLLKESDYSSIVNISSVSAKRGGTSLAYGVAKAGVDRFTQSIAEELAPHGIRVNTVTPGIVGTGIHVHCGVLDDEQYRKFLEDSAKVYPLGLVKEAEVAAMIVYLSSKKACSITGADIFIDGGRLAYTADKRRKKMEEYNKEKSIKPGITVL